MDIVLILIGLFVYFVIGGYISQRHRSLVELSMVALWPAYLAGLIGRAVRAKEAQQLARKLKKLNR